MSSSYEITPAVQRLPRALMRRQATTGVDANHVTLATLFSEVLNGRLAREHQIDRGPGVPR